MCHTERGIATAMSLGGKARDIAQGIPQAVLGTRQGLHVLLTRLEAEMGSELQDRQRSAGRAFEKYMRQKHVSAAEFVTVFERLHADAVAHGMAMSRTLLSQKLLEKACLNETQELWVLQQCGGDYSRYEQIRQSIKRLPSLDFRHSSEASAWIADDHASTASSSHHANSYNPFSAGSLQRPPPDPPSYHAESYSEAVDEHASYPVEENDSTDDDFLSAESNDEEAPALAHAWIMHRKHKRNSRKGGKGKGRRKKSRGKGGVWFEEEQVFVADNQRNRDDNPPPGWTKEKWIARKLCADCGSRWHYSCKNKHSKGGQKGSGKTKGKHSFSVFMMSLAALASSAQSFMMPISSPFNMQCQPCLNLEQTAPQLHSNVQDSEHALPSFCHQMPDCDLIASSGLFSDMFSDDFVFTKPQTAPLPTLVGADEDESNIVQDSPQIQECVQHNAFTLMQEDSLNRRHSDTISAIHFVEILLHTDPVNVYFGLEPLCKEYRRIRSQTWNIRTKERWGLLLDTGAPFSCIGKKSRERFAELHDIHDQITEEPHSAKLSGIGSGAAIVRCKVHMPVGICLNSKEYINSTWIAQQLEGCGENTPPLLGLESMEWTHANISLAKWPYVYSFDTDQGRKSAELDLVHGHIVLPCDWHGTSAPDPSYFIESDHGLRCFWSESDDSPLPKIDSSSKKNGRESTRENQNFSDFSDHCVDESPTANPAPSPNHTPESSQLHGPDNPLKGATATSATACPTVSSSGPQANTTHANQAPQHPNALHTKHNDNWNPTHTNPRYMFGAFTQALKQIRLSNKQIKVMANSSTYNRKYKGLPLNTPCPIIDESGTWDVWEWWWGGGPLSGACKKEGLKVGPPIGHKSGWCLKLPHHRAELKRLLRKHKPKILFAAPTCGPWSQASTTMNPELKAAIREEELIVLEFFCECSRIQSSDGRWYMLENPQASELLKTKQIMNLTEETGGEFNKLCMCAHDLKDPVNQKFGKKPTSLVGTVKLTPRVVRWCPGNHEHQILQGTLPNGKLRTEMALHTMFQQTISSRF